MGLSRYCSRTSPCARLYRFTSCDAYLTSLQETPSEACVYRILCIPENSKQISIYYEYDRPEETMIIAQFFSCVNNTITCIHPVFDSRNFHDFYSGLPKAGPTSSLVYSIPSPHVWLFFHFTGYKKLLVAHDALERTKQGIWPSCRKGRIL